MISTITRQKWQNALLENLNILERRTRSVHFGLTACGTLSRNEKWRDKEPWWLIAVALPVVQVKNIVLYASTRETLAGRVGTAICFLPVITITTVMWLAAWGFAIAIIWRLLGFR